MACYTLIEINLDDTIWNKKARKKLGFSPEGPLSWRDVAKIKREAGVLKAMDSVRRLDPRAIVRRKGNKLTVTVQR